MTLADDLEAALEPKQVGAKPCKFGLALAAFPEDADRMLTFIAPGDDILRRKHRLMVVLADHGHPLGSSTIDRHLGRTCGCYR